MQGFDFGRRRRSSAAVVAALLVLGFAPVGGFGARVGEAAFPGENGRIAFSSDRKTADNPEGDAEIYTMKADGSDVRQITNNAIDDYQPAWSARGDRIALSRLVPGDTRQRFDIFTMQADGSDEFNLTDSPDADEQGPAWSPDGRRIAYTRSVAPFPPAEIWVIPANGADPTTVTDEGARDVSPAWSPDGRRIAFVSFRGSQVDVWLVRATGGSPTRLTQGGGGDLKGEPNWSPDGRQIVFTTGDDLDGTSRIDVIRVDGTGRRSLTRGAGGTVDASPAWSPDGHRIVFARYTRGNPGESFAMDANGSAPTRLTRASARSGADEPDWQPR